jgi:uncharacterized protein
MPRKPALKLRCPTCKKSVQARAPDFPFCSERCRLIDLGRWASGAYVISSPVQDVSEAIGEGELGEFPKRPQ